MIRILAAIVGREAARGKPIETLDQHVAGISSRLTRQPGEDGEAAEAIHQDVHCLLPAEEQRIAFPVADLGALIGGRRPGVDERALGNRAGVHPPALAPTALLLAPAKILVELLLPTQGRVVVEAVDGLVVDHRPALLPPQSTGDLLGGPALLE